MPREFLLECGHTVPAPGPCGFPTGRAWCSWCDESFALREPEPYHGLADRQRLADLLWQAIMLRTTVRALRRSPLRETVEHLHLYELDGVLTDLAGIAAVELGQEPGH